MRANGKLLKCTTGTKSSTDLQSHRHLQTEKEYNTKCNNIQALTQTREKKVVRRREKTMLQLQGSPSPLTPTNLTATLELKIKGKRSVTLCSKFGYRKFRDSENTVLTKPKQTSDSNIPSPHPPNQTSSTGIQITWGVDSVERQN